MRRRAKKNDGTNNGVRSDLSFEPKIAPGYLSDLPSFWLTLDRRFFFVFLYICILMPVCFYSYNISGLVLPFLVPPLYGL